MNNQKLKGIWNKVSQIPELASVIPLLILVIGITIINPRFVSGSNIANIAKMMSIWGMLAVGECFIMMVGEIDISISGMCCWCGMFFAWLFSQLQMHWAPAIIITILLAVICSMFNGFLIIKAKLPAFVVSIGMNLVYGGLAKFITASQPISLNNTVWGKEFVGFGSSRIFGTGWGFPILIVVFIVAWFLLHKTAYGRKVTATGDSLIAARISGVDTDKIKYSTFLISGVLVGMVACLMVGRETVANPNNCKGWEMNCIAACAIGGTSMDGGSGSVIGLFFGVAFMAAILNALNFLSVNSNWQNIIIGFSIMISVTLDVLRRQKKIGAKVR